jgi:hypothetical protein
MCSRDRGRAGTLQMQQQGTAFVQTDSIAQQHCGQNLHTSARCEDRLLLRSARVFTRFSCSRASCHALVPAVTSSLQARSAR